MGNKTRIVDFVLQNHLKRDYEYHSCRYLHISSNYLTTTLFNTLNHKDTEIERETIIFVKKCKNLGSGYGSTENYPSTLFNTMLSCQIQFMLGVHFYDEKTITF